MGNGSLGKKCDESGKCKCRKGFAGDTCNKCLDEKLTYPNCCEEIEVKSCADDKDACASNKNGLTACLAETCVVPVEVDTCANNATACAGNTNGCIACFNGKCVVPVEVTDCDIDENACAKNTNGLTVCLNKKCVSKDKCGLPKYVGDGYCDDVNNKAACKFDGGDCCGANIKKDFCTVCACLG